MEINSVISSEISSYFDYQDGLRVCVVNFNQYNPVELTYEDGIKKLESFDMCAAMTDMYYQYLQQEGVIVDKVYLSHLLYKDDKSSIFDKIFEADVLLCIGNDSSGGEIYDMFTAENLQRYNESVKYIATIIPIEFSIGSLLPMQQTVIGTFKHWSEFIDISKNISLKLATYIPMLFTQKDYFSLGLYVYYYTNNRESIDLMQSFFKNQNHGTEIARDDIKKFINKISFLKL